MTGKLTLAAVFPLTNLTGELLLRSPAFLGRTLRYVRHQSRFLGKGGPAVWAGAKPSLVFLLVLPQVPLQAVALAGCQLDFVKKKVFLKGLIFKKKGFCNKKKGFPCQMDSFLIPAKGFFTSCILK